VIMSGGKIPVGRKLGYVVAHPREEQSPRLPIVYKHHLGGTEGRPLSAILLLLLLIIIIIISSSVTGGGMMVL
jgi:hypothetical protein